MQEAIGFLTKIQPASVGTLSGAWLSWLERHLDTVEVQGSNPCVPTRKTCSEMRSRFR